MDEHQEQQSQPETEPAATSAEKLAVEKWAEKKGLWPQFGPAPVYALPAGAVRAGGTIQVDMRAIRGAPPNKHFWKFAAAKAHEGWPEGKELTEAEFDEAIKVATSHVAR